MAGVTKVNGFLGNFTTGALRSGSNPPHGDGLTGIQLFKVTVKNDSDTAVALTDKDGDAAGEANQLVELIIQELQPLAYEVTSTTGVINIIMDGHAVDAASMQARIRPIVVGEGTGSVVANNNTTVEVATGMTLTV